MGGRHYSARQLPQPSRSAFSLHCLGPSTPHPLLPLPQSTRVEVAGVGRRQWCTAQPPLPTRALLSWSLSCSKQAPRVKIHRPGTALMGLHSLPCQRKAEEADKSSPPPQIFILRSSQSEDPSKKKATKSSKLPLLQEKSLGAGTLGIASIGHPHDPYGCDSALLLEM